jgi:transposase
VFAVWQAGEGGLSRRGEPAGSVYGRIDKTLHTLTYIDDEAKRRATLTQLNRGEGRHSVARAVFHGKHGELRQNYREGQEDQLGALVSVASRVLMRSRIVLLAAGGLQNLEIAEQMQIAPRIVNRWRECFLKLGMPGLLKDAPRPGRTPSIPAAVIAQVIEKTTQSSPVNATHGSRSTMAREMGISDSTVGRIWRANGLKPHRVDSFKISNDPQFAEKLEAIVGLYLNPPEHAWCCLWMRTTQPINMNEFNAGWSCTSASTSASRQHRPHGST